MNEMLGSLIIAIGFGSALAYLPLQLYTAFEWRGGWLLLQ